MTPEGKVKEAIKKWLRDHDCISAAEAWKVIERGESYVGWYWMPVQGMYATKGVPDFIICYKGRFVAIEAKAPGESTTPNQDTQIEAITSAGGRVFVVSSVSMLDELLGEAVPA